MGSIYKRERVWYLDIRVNGRRVRKRVGTSKKVAELALKDAEVSVARDEFGFARSDISIEKFVISYLEYSKANHQPKTTDRYGAVTDHLLAFLSTSRKDVVFISQLSAEVMEQYKAYRKEGWVNPNGDVIKSEDDVTIHTRKGARAKTINFELSAIRTLLNIAIEWGYLKVNPMRNVKRLKADQTGLPRFLTERECKRLLRTTPRELHPIFYTFLNTGLRKSELENLKWSDVDLRRKRIAIRRKEDWRPKSGEREVPLNGGMVELLGKLKQANTSGLKSDYAFPHSDGSRLHVKLREKLIQIAQRANIKDLTKLHTLRHTFASQLIMKGVDIATVKDLLGHSDIQMTMIYAHLSPEHLSDAVDRLSF